MPAIYSRLRQWDVSSSARVDRFAANSRFIRQRIQKVWRREAEVIHPPVDVGLFTPSLETDPYYLWVGAMVPYKRPDVAVDAFNANGLPLVMVGSGGMLKELRAKARDNITFVDRMDFNSLRRTFARARAYVMTAEEDFGITPVEAMASGRPVIAFGRGGALDSVVPNRTGILFERQHPEALVEAVERMEEFLPRFDPVDAIDQASEFAPERFDERFREFANLV
jgi:glycosyltransferase involved in cell wall biosynthesis